MLETIVVLALTGLVSTQILLMLSPRVVFMNRRGFVLILLTTLWAVAAIAIVGWLYLGSAPLILWQLVLTLCVVEIACYVQGWRISLAQRPRDFAFDSPSVDGEAFGNTYSIKIVYVSVGLTAVVTAAFVLAILYSPGSAIIPLLALGTGLEILFLIAVGALSAIRPIEGGAARLGPD